MISVDCQHYQQQQHQPWKIKFTKKWDLLDKPWHPSGKCQSSRRSHKSCHSWLELACTNMQGRWQWPLPTSIPLTCHWWRLLPASSCSCSLSWPGWAGPWWSTHLCWGSSSSGGCEAHRTCATCTKERKVYGCILARSVLLSGTQCMLSPQMSFSRYNLATIDQVTLQLAT